MKPIDKNTINEFENLTSSDSHVRSIRNATFRNNLIEVAMDWDPVSYTHLTLPTTPYV